MKARLAIASTLAVLTALVLTATASASEPLEDGEYSITVSEGVAIGFTISDDGQTVTVSSMPDDFEVLEDDSSDGDTTKITDGTVTVEIETGDDGKIEVDGVSFVEATTVSALLPDAAGAVGITYDGEEVNVTVPAGFRLIDVDEDDDEVEVLITDDVRTFEIEVDLEDGSVEIKLQDDDSRSEDDDSEDSDSEDDESDEARTDDSVLDDSVSDDDLSDDDVSDDDDSSDDQMIAPTDETTGTTAPATTTTTSDDDNSSDDDDQSDDDSDRSEDDQSDDDSSD